MLSLSSSSVATCYAHRSTGQIRRLKFGDLRTLHYGPDAQRCELRVPAASSAASSNSSSSTPVGVGVAWPSGTFTIDMHVRDYELDQFNVVNNAIFASYLQHARHEALAALGHDVDASARAGAPLALSELNMRFRAPLRSRDSFQVKVWVQKLSGVRAVLGQQVLLLPKASNNGGSSSSSSSVEPQVVLEAEAVVVWLDSAYKPARIPPDVRAELSALHRAWVAASGQ